MRKMSLKSIFLIIFLSSLAFYSSGHVFRAGECPEIEPMQDFDPEKFVGEWNVIQKFRTTSECIKEEIKVDDHKRYFMTKYFIILFNFISTKRLI